MTTAATDLPFTAVYEYIFRKYLVHDDRYQRTRINALTAQVAALHEALTNEIAEHRGQAPSHPIYSGPTGEYVLANTAAAAEALKRQQRLEGARELVRRSWSTGTPWSGVDAVRHSALKSILADMEHGT